MCKFQIGNLRVTIAMTSLRNVVDSLTTAKRTRKKRVSIRT